MPTLEKLFLNNFYVYLTGVLFADAEDASPTTEVDVPMTNDDVDVEMVDDDDVDAEDENCFLVELPVPVELPAPVAVPDLRVKDLLMLPQSAGMLARVWKT
jgi:hypothetical protein